MLLMSRWQYQSTEYQADRPIDGRSLHPSVEIIEAFF
jgi:hypothetical protein